MRYLFTGLHEAPRYEDRLDVSIDGVHLSELGVQVLEVSGRGHLQSSHITVVDDAVDGAVFINRRREAIGIAITGLALEEQEGGHLYIGEQLNALLSRQELKVQVSDDDYYYIASPVSCKIEGKGKQGSFELVLKAYSGYKYKDVSFYGPEFLYHTDLPAEPTLISITMADKPASSLSMTIQPSGQTLMLEHLELKPGDVIELRSGDIFGVTRGGQNLLPYLRLDSTFEQLQLSYKDMLLVNPTPASIYTEARLRRYG